MLRTSSSHIITLVSLLLLCPAIASADVFIAEFSIGGGTGQSDNDYIELYNSGTKTVSLEHWKLRKRTAGSLEKPGTESSIKEFDKEDCIAPGKTFLWTNSKAASAYKDQANATSTATLTPDNSLALFDEKGAQRDAIIFGSGHYQPFTGSIILSNPLSALAHVRDPLTLAWSENLPPTPTGGAADACIAKPDSPADPPTPPSNQTNTIRINEIFPDPDTPQDAGEYIELWNTGDTAIDISGWKITDATKTGRYIFPPDTIIRAGAYLVITDQDFAFSLNNTHETLSLADANGIIQDTVTYEKSTEGASLNLTESGWRGSKTLTPGQMNILSNALPSTQERVPKKGYRDIYLDFRARGKDSDGDRLKYVWDFGDGHKSYQENARHRYEKTGNYTVTLTTRDGSEEISETFSLKIEKFDPPKLRITALMPNPNGKDTGAEWIEIMNHSKKDVELKGYSIATGTKKPANHPIRESFIIPKQTARRLTHVHSLFTLPNEKGKVELRAPDGKVIHDLKYTFEKSLADNVILKKEKGKRLTVSLPVRPEADTREVTTPTDPHPQITIPPAANLPEQGDPEEETRENALETAQNQSRRERTARLLALTTRGTSLIFSDQAIESIAATSKKQEAIPPVSAASSEPDPLRELLLHANTWLNSLSAVLESESREPELLSPESQMIQEPLPEPTLAP